MIVTRGMGLVALMAVVASVGAGCGHKGGEGAPGGGQPAGKGGGGGGGGKGAIQFPVEVAPVDVQDVEYVVSAVGSVDAFERVQITARVAGVVERVGFTEGQAVKKGDVLAEIEPARYTLAVNAAKAALEKAQAAQAEAQAGAQRRTAVNEQRPGLLPAEEVQSYETKARTAVAEVSAAKAALDQAELNLRDAYVRAPMDGVLQTRTVQTGQYAQPGYVLATLLRRDPLLLRFRVPESDVARIKPGMMARFTVRADSRTYEAKITYVADAADDQSRMVPVTAEVAKEDAPFLRPGAFATVAVPVATSKGAPVVPQTAVRPSDPALLVRLKEQNALKQAALASRIDTEDFRNGFVMPLPARSWRRTGRFGGQRILNGEPKRPHYGTDLAAPKGTAILAPAGGVVSMAAAGMHFEGGLTMIDHGQGLVSIYLHQSKIVAKAGQRVERGEKIGEVGATGRATGPHLCWRMTWRGRHLDPMLLVGQTAPA